MSNRISNINISNDQKIHSSGGDLECVYCQRNVSEGQGLARATEVINNDTWNIYFHNRSHVPLTEEDFENYPIEIIYNSISEQEVDYNQLEKDTKSVIFKLYKALEKDTYKFPISYFNTSISFDSIRSIVRKWNKNPAQALSIDIDNKEIYGREISEKDVYEKRYFGRVVSIVTV
jgi:hypothetical protein